MSEKVYWGEPLKEELHNRREKYVGKAFLSALAVQVGLDNALIMPEGQVKEGGRTNQSNLHTVFEAVIGAVHQDQGFDAAKRFLLETMLVE